MVHSSRATAEKERRINGLGIANFWAISWLHSHEPYTIVENQRTNQPLSIRPSQPNDHCPFWMRCSSTIRSFHPEPTSIFVSATTSYRFSHSHPVPKPIFSLPLPAPQRFRHHNHFGHPANQHKCTMAAKLIAEQLQCNAMLPSPHPNRKTKRSLSWALGPCTTYIAPGNSGEEDHVDEDDDDQFSGAYTAHDIHVLYFLEQSKILPPCTNSNSSYFEIRHDSPRHWRVVWWN